MYWIQTLRPRLSWKSLVKRCIVKDLESQMLIKKMFEVVEHHKWGV